MNRLLLMAAHCGVGLAPAAPGTWGSLVGLGLFALVHWLFPVALTPGLIAICALGLAASKAGEEAWGQDAGKIVIDEVAGQWLTLLIFHQVWWAYLFGFGLFRLFDILKPWPISAAEKLPGAWGVMADDLLAGLMAGLCLFFLGALLG